MAATEKRGMLTLMAEVVWRPRSAKNPARENSHSTLQKRTSTDSLGRTPKNLGDIFQNPDYKAEFEAHLKELDGDPGDPELCGFSDVFAFYIGMQDVELGANLNQMPWTRYFPKDLKGAHGLELATMNSDYKNSQDLKRNCGEAIRREGGLDAKGLEWLRKASQVCLNQLTMEEAGEEEGIVKKFIHQVEERTQPSKLNKVTMCILL